MQLSCIKKIAMVLAHGDHVLYSFQSQGLRITKARQALVEIFEEAAKPLNAKQLEKMLSSKGIRIHKVTLYREIEFLKNQEVIREVNLGTEKKIYESTQREHHHHLVCLDCEKIEEIPVSKELEKVENSLYKKAGFSMIRHAAEFFGLCKKCEKAY